MPTSWVTPCPGCPRKYRAIGGSGPQPAPVLCIAERPGRDENSRGEVLVGKTGQEFDQLYLPLAGLDRTELRASNTVLCWADSNKTPSDKDIRACAAHHLPEEIKRTGPEVIILLGSSACSLVPGVRLDLHHGIPQPTSKVGDLFGWEGWVVPMYHPAIGLHESRWMQICMEDWQRLGRHLGHFPAGLTDHWEGDPPSETVHYSVWTDRHSWLRGEHPIGIDTESHGGIPWSVQVSARPGMGVLYPTANRAAMDHLRWMLLASDECVFHNAAYDLEVLRKLGIAVRSYRDTMQEAFHLGDLPQGLKALAYRLFRHTMTSYEETVRPASLSALIEWMTEAFLIAESDLCFIERRQLKTKVKEIVHKGELESLLRRLIAHTDLTSEYDPWQRLGEFWKDPLKEWMVSHIEARAGRYPILGIANCSMDEAVQYAVGDADWTGRVAVELERRREGAFPVFKGDRDV